MACVFSIASYIGMCVVSKTIWFGGNGLYLFDLVSWVVTILLGKGMPCFFSSCGSVKSVKPFIHAKFVVYELKNTSKYSFYNGSNIISISWDSSPQPLPLHYDTFRF